MEDKITERIVIDEQAEKLILITFRQYRVLAILGIASMVISVMAEVIHLPRFLKADTTSWYDYFILKISPFLILLQTLSSLGVLYFYFNGVRLQQKSLADMDQLSFSNSFQSYKKGNYLSIINCCILIFYFGVILYHELIK